jgi:hypothetical protein
MRNWQRNKILVREIASVSMLIGCWLFLLTVNGYTQTMAPIKMPLDSLKGIEFIDGQAEVSNYHGRRAVHFLPLGAPKKGVISTRIGLINQVDFKNGTIEVDVAGAPGPEAASDDRGFIGVAFRAQDHGEKAEDIYLRPTNGRADDQLRRNHSVQYESEPDFPWHRLRQESPGVYESYCDLETGEWTKMKIVVSGTKARLFVNGASQPCLVVNDLKLGESHGLVGIWAYITTDAYFSNLLIEPAP